MKLLREYVRELLTEAAKGPGDLPSDVGIAYILLGDGGISVMYYHMGEKTHMAWSESAKQQGMPRGKISIGPPTRFAAPDGPCSGALMIYASSATHGWGPMLYDVAMELATIHGGGLMSDRASVSGAARKVWDYYAANRGDVTGIQMDDLENTLTPEERDNCNQNVATYSTGYPSANTTDWTKSPLSKRWTKPPTTMTALEAAGKLVEL